MGWIKARFSILQVVNTFTWGSTFLCESSFCLVGQKPACIQPSRTELPSLRVHFPNLCPASWIYHRWTPFKVQKHFKGQEKWRSPESWSSNVVAEPEYYFFFLQNFSRTKCEKAKESENLDCVSVYRAERQKKLIASSLKKLHLHIHEIIGGQATLKHNRDIKTAGWDGETQCQIHPIASPENMTHAILYQQQAEEKHKRNRNRRIFSGWKH